MSTQDKLNPHKARKFLFDINNFDDKKEPEEIVEYIPPPPTFSEAELAAAKQIAFDQGNRQGHAEAQESFEKQTADMLGIIRDHLRILFDEEDRRANQFEKEAVQLAYTIFAKAFPAMNEKQGLDEVRRAIENVLETVHEQPEIIIEVPPAYVDAIQSHIDGLLRRDGGPRCVIRANDGLSAGSCRLAWVNGTASRNGMQLAEQIHHKIEQVLADKAILPDNDEVTPDNAATNHGERDE